MGKRSLAKKAKYREQNNVEQLHPIGGSWDPVADGAEQKYRKNIVPQNDNQRQLIESIREHTLSLALGPAGTGKTYLAIALAVEALEKNEVSRIILSRPAIEAGENLGFLPGSMEDKLLPYLRPLYDCLGERLGHKRLKHYLSDSTIEIVPLAYMRGRTFNNCFVVVDEAQNCTYNQIKMLLTRLGWHSSMVITGDPDQSDLLPGISGLEDIAGKLEALNNIGVVNLEAADVVRHPLVADMLSVL